MTPRCALIAGLLACLYGCNRKPDAYPPPAQTTPLSGTDPSSLRAYVRANETGADAHYLRDVNTFVEGGTFRWTKQKPTFQFKLESTLHQRLKMDFAIHSEVIGKTGPITISYYVNGNLLERVRYTKDGEQHYEKAVPPEFITLESPTIVMLELDKVLETPDGNRLGLVLTGSGFVE